MSTSLAMLSFLNGSVAVAPGGQVYYRIFVQP
uniref:Uncharacterized protein n=1 Tax=Arundo donax TaxID=35708 RepID=A0A0A9BKC9_ARUDO